MLFKSSLNEAVTHHFIHIEEVIIFVRHFSIAIFFLQISDQLFHEQYKLIPVCTFDIFINS